MQGVNAECIPYEDKVPKGWECEDDESLGRYGMGDWSVRMCGTRNGEKGFCRCCHEPFTFELGKQCPDYSSRKGDEITGE